MFGSQHKGDALSCIRAKLIPGFVVPLGAPREEGALNFKNETLDTSVKPKVPKMMTFTLK